MNPISVALEGKGLLNLLRRGVDLTRHYGLATRKMAQALARFAAVLRRFRCGATFPVTAVALQRAAHIIGEYQAQDIEFAVHGYRHIDYTQLELSEQLRQMGSAAKMFAKLGIHPRGFRSPYLRRNQDTLLALQQRHFIYESSQAITWDVLGSQETPAYLRALTFYGAQPAAVYPSLPSLEGDLVCIPYSLPDDEAIVNRLNTKIPSQDSTWLAILDRVHELDELFTIGLHPERIAICEEPLVQVLSKARQLVPPVWIARLDQIAAWWRDRGEAMVEIRDNGVIEDNGGHQLCVSVTGPKGTTVLARAVKVDASTVPWANGYRRMQAVTFSLQAPLRPFIGLSPTVSSELASFLRQQGYILEFSEERHLYPYYFGGSAWSAEAKRSLLSQIEDTDRPLVRLGRWPNGARGALSITGDIDAFTLWDYGLRLLGK